MSEGDFTKSAKGDLERLLQRIEAIKQGEDKMDPGETHAEFDDAMLDYIGDDRVRALYAELCLYFD